MSQELTPEVIEKACQFLQAVIPSGDLQRLWRRRATLLNSCPELKGNQEFETCYSKVNDILVPKILGDCRYCKEGKKTHFAVCIKEGNK